MKTTKAIQRGLMIGGMAAAILALNTYAVQAQEGPPAPPPGGFGGGPGGPGGFGGGPGGPGGFGRRARVETLASAPLEALAAGLKLTDTQAEDIKAIQAAARPPRGGGRRGQGGQGGQRPDFAAMQQERDQAEKKATKDIEALLTVEQKEAVPGLLKDIQMLRAANVPAELIGDLKLTSAQKTRLASLGAGSQKTMQQKMQEAQESGDFQSMRQVMEDERTNLDKQVKAALTDTQNALIAKFKAANPQRGGFGGPGGGFGGGRRGPGGPGGPPGGEGDPGGPGGPPPEK